jgi:hypothetical protein
MTALNLLHPGRIGFESRNLSRRSRRFDLQSEPLEFRRLLSIGPVAPVASANPSQAIGASTSGAVVSSPAPPATVGTFSPPPATTAVANPTTAVQANLPTDNSSTTNTPGVSPTLPAPPNVLTDDSTSAATSSTSGITALIPSNSPLTVFSEAPVYLVPMPVDPETVQLAIETPGLQTSNLPVTLQLTSSSVTFQAINSPVGVPAASPPGTQANNSPGTTQNQPPTSIQHIGQGLESELQKPVKPNLGPEPEAPRLTDIVEPATPGKTESPKTEPPKTEAPKTEAPKTEAPKTEAPKTEAPKTDAPMDATRPQQQQPSGQDAAPVWWLPLPVPIPVPLPTPANQGAAPAASGDSSPRAMRSGLNAHTGLATLFGVVAVVGGGYHLAMGESQRFGMAWLPSRAASTRSARPRVSAR